MMTQHRKLPRRALLLMAAAALPATPLLAQDQPPVTDVTVPPVTAPVQSPVTQPPVTQPPVTAPVTPPPSATVPTPATEAPATPERRTTTRTTRSTARTAPTARASAPVRRAAPAAAAPVPAAATPAATPAPAADSAATAPVAAPAPLPVPEEEPASDGPSIWMWLIGGALLALLGFALFNMRRHRTRADEYDSYHEEAPVMAPPVMAEPVREIGEPAPMIPAAAAAGAGLMAADPGYRREVEPTPMGDVVAPEEFAPAAEETVAVAEEADIAAADPADVEALAAASAAPDGRPWLEFLMRPVRAGTSKDSAIVEFELTVGNTGTAPARDVRISTFMFAAGSAGESEMERMLIDPPADAAVAEVEIAAGDATRVETTMSLPRDALGDESVLPVVVADARYRLPDGSEGRTRASFEVGIPSDDGLDPFPTDRVSGLLEGVDARLHDEPERV